MKKKKNYLKLFSLIFMILFCCAFQTIVYSAINGTLTVKGDAYARAEADVRITGFRLNRTLNATSSYEEFGKNHITTEISLLNPSSSISYYVEITNYGSEDAGIFDITGLPSVVNYSIKDYNLQDKICDDTGKCNNFIKKTLLITLTTTDSFAGSIQMNFEFRTYHTVTYTDIENKGYPTEVIDGGTLKIPFQEDLKRVQLLYNNREILYYQTVTNGQTITLSNITHDVEVKIKEPVAKLVNGSINKIGSQVCIEDECFYIMKNDGSTVTMLSKYNLHVGSKWTGKAVIALENPTGIQDKTAIGWFNGRSESNPVIGTVAVYAGTESYWKSTTSSYPAYIYNSNSIMYNYLENYKIVLTNKGASISNIRLIDINELNALGCNTSTNLCTNSSYSWLYSTSYWTGNASSDGNVWNVMTDGSINSTMSIKDFSVGNDILSEDTWQQMLYGARPVIEMPVDEINVPPAKLVSGDADTQGSQVCIGNECFYTISSTEDTITMLAKYNLYAIGSYENGTGIYTRYNDTATKIQNPLMTGWQENITTYEGVYFFSESNYWIENISNYPSYVFNSSSPLYQYLVNYKKYLENHGATINDSRLITYEEVEKLGCSGTNNTCSSAPSWVYSTSYWTGSAKDDNNIWYVRTNKQFKGREYNFTCYFGIRPVITIPKKEIMKTNEFKIGSSTYKAEIDMTWEEWIESKYNTNGYTMDGEFIYFDGENIGTTGGCPSPNEKIDTTLEYKILSYQC